MNSMINILDLPHHHNQAHFLNRILDHNLHLKKDHHYDPTLHFKIFQIFWLLEYHHNCHFMPIAIIF